MKGRNSSKRVDKVMDCIKTTGSLLALTDASSKSLEFSSIKHPELLEVYEKVAIQSAHKKTLSRK
jgi:hypothetical protein